MSRKQQWTLADLFWFSVGVRRGRRKAARRARRDGRGRYNGSRTASYR